MTSRTRFAIPAALAVALMHGCASAPPAPNLDALVARLTAQADRWDKAIVRKDRAAIEANMAEE